MNMDRHLLRRNDLGIKYEHSQEANTNAFCLQTFFSLFKDDALKQ